MSIGVHAIAIAALGFLFQSSSRTRHAVVVAPVRPVQMVWIPDPRLAARGGGRPKETRAAALDKPAVPTLQPIPAIVAPPAIVPEAPPQPIAEVAPVIPAAGVETGAPRASAGDGEKPGSGLGPTAAPAAVVWSTESAMVPRRASGDFVLASDSARPCRCS